MPRFFLTVFCFAYSTIAFSQKSDFLNEYKQLIESVQSGSWITSEKICKKLIDFCEPIDSMQHEAKVLRYIYIYSTAGLLNENKLTQKEALAQVKNMIGKEMIMPAHPFKSNCYVNCSHLSENDKNTFFTSSNNENGTQIFAFEYVKIKDGIKETVEELEGKFIITMGTLNEVTVEGQLLPRFKLLFTNGQYLIKD